MVTTSITVRGVLASTMPLDAFDWSLCHPFSTSSLRASSLRSTHCWYMYSSVLMRLAVFCRFFP